ncbi:MAG: DsbA family protein [Bacillota bacterium]|nr:DsbA family protein [Bacillota bacterium]MDW7683580.1 DsbA family protein [Bacillota bacterium]
MGKGIVDELKKEFDIQDIWQGVEIHPETPPEGRDMSDLFPLEKREQYFLRLNEMGKDYGIVFKRSNGYLANSRRALLLGEYAKSTNSFEALHSALFKAYFTEGKDIGDCEVLLQLAKSAGLSREEVEQAWQNENLIHPANITAVPTFEINGGDYIVGVRSYNAFREALHKAGRL